MLVMAVGYGVWTQTYRYDNDKACEYVGENALDKSHSCCAWFVMRAMQEGGCPIGILPAWAYRYALPLYGYKEVYSGKGKECPPTFGLEKGGLVVIPRGSYSIWGHIAMYDGQQWVSDFKQSRMSPYRRNVKYRIYRRK